jgi:hypothetical protein
VPLIRFKLRCPRGISATFNKYVDMDYTPEESDARRAFSSNEGLELVSLEVVRK